MCTLVGVCAALSSCSASPARPETTVVRAADGAGAAPIGSTAYPVPVAAVFAAPDGRNDAAGTVDAPVRTIARALAITPPDGTVVLRAGVYHEFVSVTKKTVTIQSYPHEAVWLDGSVPLRGWTMHDGHWYVAGWHTRFDASPTYTRGAADGTRAGWVFVSPSHPMAAHPDQVFIGDVPQQQVRSVRLLRAGDFYVDDTLSRLYLGSDPRGHSVRATTIAKAMTVQTPGTIVRGVGIRRFAPSVWMMGAVTLERARDRLENVVLLDIATTGVSAVADGVTLTRVTTQRCGMLGIHASKARRLGLDAVLSTDNNTEQFNNAPVSGGVKIGSSTTVVISNSAFLHNDGPGVWLDESSQKIRVVGNNIVDNSGSGLSLEISSHVDVADNLILGNGRNGIKVNDTDHVDIVNNTVRSRGRAISIVQDSRRPDVNRSTGLGAGAPAAADWKVRSVSVLNNVMVVAGPGANCVLCVEDYTRKRTAEDMEVTSDGNVYNRLSPRQPAWLVVWSRGKRDPAVLPSLRRFADETGQDSHSLLFDTGQVLDSLGVLAPSLQAQARTVAIPLPPLAGHLSGTGETVLNLGVWWQRP